MWKHRFVILAALLLLAFTMGCSGARNMQGLVGPVDDNRTPVTAKSGPTVCLGLWEVTVTEETGTIEAVEMRSSDLIINVLGFLEPPPLSGMQIDFSTLDIDSVNKAVHVDVILKHPIDNPVFTGFDVRGVVFGPEVTNADGLTVIPSPEFFKDVPFGYQDGLLGTSDSLADYSGLAGYKYFCNGLGQDDDLTAFMSSPANLANRGMFANGATLRRHYDLSWADTTPPITLLIFNYAIYANYNWPMGEPPITIDDFEMTTTNSAEAFCSKVTETHNSLWYAGGSGGGSIGLDVEVWDWQGNINDVTIESIPSGVIVETSYDSTSAGSTSRSYMYHFDDVPGSPTSDGDLRLLITATDSITFGGAWFMGLLPTSNSLYGEKVYNCWTYTAQVGTCPEPGPTSVLPGNHAPDNVTFSAIVNGTDFVAGTSLAVKFKKTGEPDINATNLSFVSATQLTCDVTIPLDTALGLRDVEVVNGCGTPGTGTELFEVTCPTPGVSSISPKEHNADGVQFSATIAGSNFVGGSSLAVALTKSSCPDIDATNVGFSSSTQITCDLAIPSGTADGLWNVQVTNGCGTEGTGNGLFTVIGVETGPKNIKLRDPSTPAWDLAVDWMNGDLFILYSDRQIWRHRSDDYTKGEYATETKNLNPEGVDPDKGWIDIGWEGYMIVGLDYPEGSVLASWGHHGNVEPYDFVSGQQEDKYGYHACGDVMASNEGGPCPHSHLGVFGIDPKPWETHIWQTQEYPFEVVVNECIWKSDFDDYSRSSFMASLIRGLEWSQNGEYFWCVKGVDNDS